LPGCLQILRDGDTTNFFEFAQGRGAIGGKSRNNDSDESAVPMLCQRTKKDGNHIGPSSRFRYRSETELPFQNVQVALGRNDKYLVGPNDQLLRDQ
jgi:hypothetical protein